MHRQTWIPLLGAAALALATTAATAAFEAESLLKRASEVMGATNLKTLRYSVSGSGAFLGRSFDPRQAPPKITFESYVRSINYGTASMREEIARTRAQPRDEGFLPVSGPQRLNLVVSGNYAWNVVGPANFPARLDVNDRLHDLWTTPHGAIMAAQKNKSTLDFHGTHALVRFTEPGRFTAVVHVNEKYLVEKVESRVPHPVLGDIAVVTSYSEYRDVGNVRFPTRIRQTMGGFETMDVRVGEVQPDAAVDIEVPAPVRAATENVTSTKVADGVWFVAGGSHNSVAIEMKDHMVLVESPLGDGRAIPLIEAVKKLAGKPIRYVVSTHNHFDHSGGVRAAAAEGATIVGEKRTVEYFAKVFANPNSIAPDALARSKKKPKFMAVSGKRILSDGARTVEVHALPDSPHADDFVVVYLPKEKLLVEADVFTPPPPGTPAPATPRGTTVNLVDNIERLKLAVDTILPLHGRVVPVADLYTAAGRKR